MFGRLLAVAVGLMASACVRSNTTACGDEMCPEGLVCAGYRDKTLCVLPAQKSACDGRVDGERCSLDFDGTCYSGTCFPVGCGNGTIDDPLYETNEQCDDKNLLGHDGCSSTCKVENPTWDEISNAQLVLTCGHATAADTSRGMAVMFGGISYGTTGTWEFCEKAWVQRRPQKAPALRDAHAMANDGRRQRVVLFGGRFDAMVYGDTWEWDGTAWNRYNTATKPPARHSHAMAYDSTRGVTVMVGGRSSTSVILGDVWEWDGTDWTRRDDVGAPPPSEKHAMAYDPARSVSVLVTGPRNAVEVWEYDGIAFRKIPTSGGPPDVTGAAMAYDAVDRKMLVHGGDSPSASTWSWDGVAWTERATTPTPIGRSGGAATTDPVSGRALWVAGLPYGLMCAPENPSPVATTWESTSTAWSSIGAPTSDAPETRFGYAAALDTHRQRIVMFGGSKVGNAPASNETWELGASGWSKVTTTNTPSARKDVGMAYDAARREIVMFGGIDEPYTWTLKGVNWTRHDTPNKPRACTGFGISYDANRKVVVLFGGVCGGFSAYFRETWEWNGAAWTQVATTGPGPRSDLGLAYDPILRTTILFGGLVRSSGLRRLSDTWSWDGATWTERNPAATPEGRSHHGMAWDPTRQRLVIVGGSPVADIWELDASEWTPVPAAATTTSRVVVPAFDGAGLIVLTAPIVGTIQVQRLRWNAATQYEACWSGDHDRDGLIGCADPDCWASCAPSCPPGAQCDPTAERCGDGACSARETCQACPDDCGVCPARCGDFICSPGEDCPGDCDW